MVKRFHYFKSENSNIISESYPANMTPFPSSSSSLANLYHQEIDFYEISYKTSPTQSSIRFQVPANFTVFQDHHHKPECESTSSGDNKIRVFLLGSEFCPDLSHLSQSYFDRIEFHGSIRYEKPVFEIIGHLKELKKVKFFLGKRQRLEFFEWLDWDWTHQLCINQSVTSLAIFVSKQFCWKLDHEGKAFNPPLSDEEQMDPVVNVIERIVLRILAHVPICYPSLRKLTMKVPNSVRIHEAVLDMRNKLEHLKNVRIGFSEDENQIIVSKRLKDVISTPRQQVLENCEMITSPEVEEDDYYYEDHAEIQSETPEPLLEQLEQMDDDDTHIDCSIDEELCDKTDNETSVTDEEDEPELINAIEEKIVVDDLVQKYVETSINEEIEKLEEKFLTLLPESPPEEDKEEESKPESPNALTGMGRILESMLGIGSGGGIVDTMDLKRSIVGIEHSKREENKNANNLLSNMFSKFQRTSISNNLIN